MSLQDLLDINKTVFGDVKPVISPCSMVMQNPSINNTSAGYLSNPHYEFNFENVFIYSSGFSCVSVVFKRLLNGVYNYQGATFYIIDYISLYELIQMSQRSNPSYEYVGVSISYVCNYRFGTTSNYVIINDDKDTKAYSMTLKGFSIEKSTCPTRFFIISYPNVQRMLPSFNF